MRSILILIIVFSVVFGISSQQCTRCNFTCPFDSKKDSIPGYCPSDDTKIMQNGDQTNLPLVDLKLLECLENNCPCNYVPMNGMCGSVLGNSGNTIGMGIDIGQFSKEQLKKKNISEIILNKFDGYYGVKGPNALKTGMEKRVNLTESELNSLNSQFLSESIAELEKKYNSQKKTCITFTKIPRAIRSCFHAIIYLYGYPKEFSEQMYSLNFAALLTNLRNVSGWQTYDIRLPQCADIIQNTIKEVKQSKDIDFGKVNTLCSKCESGAADVVFLVDSSGSITKRSFQNQVLPFVKDVISELDVSLDKIHIGVVQFSTEVEEIFKLDYTYNKSVMYTKIDSIEYMSSGTDTAYGIMFVLDNIFPMSKRRQENSTADISQIQQILFILTDGASNDRGYTLQIAKVAKNQGISIFSIGVGSNLDIIELEGMASDPISEHVLMLQGFVDLKSFVDRISQNVCLEPQTLNQSKSIRGTVGKDMSKYYKTQIFAGEQEGITVVVKVEKGGIELYASLSEKNPDILFADAKGVPHPKDPTLIILKIKLPKLRILHSTANAVAVDVYYSVVGREKANQFTMETRDYSYNPPIPKPDNDDKKDSSDVGTIVGVVCGSIAFIAIVVFAVYYQRKRQANANSDNYGIISQQNGQIGQNNVHEYPSQGYNVLPQRTASTISEH